MMDRKTFFDAIRKPLFGGSLSGSQVAGIDAILDEAERRATPLNHLAYILDTSHWETGRKMQPVREIGRGKGKKYGQPAGIYHHVYYGRGHVQLTWDYNYAKAGKALGVDLLKYPDKALDPKVSVAILFSGMTEGWFTGKKLADYIGTDLTDYRNARRIINGMDHASEIAANALTFQRALEKAGYKPAGKAKDADWPLDAPSMPDVAAKPADGPLPVDLPDDLADPVAESANAAERKSVKLGRWIVLFLLAVICLAIWQGLM
jgi:hypothetical protein